MEELRVNVDAVVSALRRYVAKIDSFLSERDRVREEAIRLSREIVRYSGWAVTAVHRGDLGEAVKHLEEASARVERLLSMLRPYPELYHSGTTYNAVSEYVEARLLVDIIRGEAPRGPEELGVPPVPYLQGLGDLVGELRRLALDLARRGRVGDAWKLLDIMEALYLQLRSLDYPEALMPGVRHKADVARTLVDTTKSLLIELEGRLELSRLLEESAGKLGGQGKEGRR